MNQIFSLPKAKKRLFSSSFRRKKQFFLPLLETKTNNVKSKVYNTFDRNFNNWSNGNLLPFRKAKLKPLNALALNQGNTKVDAFLNPNTYWNQCFDKGRFKNFVLWFFLNNGEHKTVQLVEQFKTLGFEYATKAGISLGIEDLKIPPKKSFLIFEAEKETGQTVKQYERGDITGVERFQRLIDTWHRTSEQLKQEVIDHFEATDILNPVYMMAFSGARGNISQVRQLVGMRGLMANPQGQIIDFPIRSNFREGLTLTEYIISSYGARKGIVDTALRTANAGYLTRRLVDVAQHIIISNFDCGTRRGIFLSDMKEGNKTIVSLQTRLVGRICARDIYVNGKKIAKRNSEISIDLAYQINKSTKKVFVRSALTCETKKLVCQLCYGWSLAQGNLVSIGEAIGVIAAQSIGEPGTQLTMRTFHTGGVFSGDISDQIRMPFTGIINYSSPIPGTLIRTPEGKIAFLTKSNGSFAVSNLAGTEKKKYKIPGYTLLFGRHGETVSEKEVVAQISSISKQKNATDDAELTIKSEIEGQFYLQNLQLKETKVGPKQKQKENDFSSRDLEFQNGSENSFFLIPNNLENPRSTPMDSVFSAWNWGNAWILSGKVYHSSLPSHFFPKIGDYINRLSSFVISKGNSSFSNVSGFTKLERPNQVDNLKSLSKSLSPYKLRLLTKNAVTRFPVSRKTQLNSLKKTLEKKALEKNNNQLKYMNNFPIYNFEFLSFPLSSIIYQKIGYFGKIEWTFFNNPALPKGETKVTPLILNSFKISSLGNIKKSPKEKGKNNQFLIQKFNSYKKNSNNGLLSSHDSLFIIPPNAQIRFNKSLINLYPSNWQPNYNVVLQWFPFLFKTKTFGKFIFENVNQDKNLSCFYWSPFKKKETNLSSSNLKLSNSTKLFQQNQNKNLKRNQQLDSLLSFKQIKKNLIKQKIRCLTKSPIILNHRLNEKKEKNISFHYFGNNIQIQKPKEKNLKALPSLTNHKNQKENGHFSRILLIPQGQSGYSCQTLVNPVSNPNIYLNSNKFNGNSLQSKSWAYNTKKNETISSINNNNPFNKILSSLKHQKLTLIKLTLKVLAKPIKQKKNLLVNQNIISMNSQVQILKNKQSPLKPLKDINRNFNYWKSKKRKFQSFISQRTIKSSNASMVQLKGGLVKFLKTIQWIYCKSEANLTKKELRLLLNGIFPIQNKKIFYPGQTLNFDFSFDHHIIHIEPFLIDLSKAIDFKKLELKQGLMSNFDQSCFVPFNKKSLNIENWLVNDKCRYKKLPSRTQSFQIGFKIKKVDEFFLNSLKNKECLNIKTEIYELCQFYENPINMLSTLSKLVVYNKGEINIDSLFLSTNKSLINKQLFFFNHIALKNQNVNELPMGYIKFVFETYPYGKDLTSNCSDATYKNPFLRKACMHPFIRKAIRKPLNKKTTKYSNKYVLNNTKVLFNKAFLSFTELQKFKTAFFNKQNISSQVISKYPSVDFDVFSNLSLKNEKAKQRYLFSFFVTLPSLRSISSCLPFGTNKKLVNWKANQNKLDTKSIHEFKTNLSYPFKEYKFDFCAPSFSYKSFLKKQSKNVLESSFNSMSHLKHKFVSVDSSSSKYLKRNYLTNQYLKKILKNETFALLNTISFFKSPFLSTSLTHKLEPSFSSKKRAKNNEGKKSFISSNVKFNVNELIGGQYFSSLVPFAKTYLYSPFEGEVLQITSPYNKFSSQISSMSQNVFGYQKKFSELLQKESSFLQIKQHTSIILTKGDLISFYFPKFNFIQNSPEIPNLTQSYLVKDGLVSLTYELIKQEDNTSSLLEDTEKEKLPLTEKELLKIYKLPPIEIGFLGIKKIKTNSTKHNLTKLTLLNHQNQRKKKQKINEILLNSINSPKPSLNNETNRKLTKRKKNQLKQIDLLSKGQAKKIRDLDLSSLLNKKTNNNFAFLLGDFIVSGDSLLLNTNLSKSFGNLEIVEQQQSKVLKTAVTKSGQIIHMNKEKVTIRKGQPLFISPKAILHKFDGDFIDPKSPVITLSYQRLKTGDIVQGIPKIEQFFEARTTKRGRLFRDSLPNLLKALFQRYLQKLPLDKAVRQSFYKIQQIIVDGVLRVYRSQGVTIADKHLEIIVKQMTSKVRILEGGQTGFFPGEIVDLEFVEQVNHLLMKKIQYEPLVLGITKSSLEVDSFLSAASFQQTTRVLSGAAIARKKDFLKGLKENVILGNLIPAGTGFLVYLNDTSSKSIGTNSGI